MGGRMTHLPFCARLFDGDDSLEEKKTEQRRWPTWRAAARGLSISGLCLYLSVVGSPSPCLCSTLADRVAGGSVSAPLCSRDPLSRLGRAGLLFLFFIFRPLTVVVNVLMRLHRTQTHWVRITHNLTNCAPLSSFSVHVLPKHSFLICHGCLIYIRKRLEDINVKIFEKILHVVRIRGEKKHLTSTRNWS